MPCVEQNAFWQAHREAVQNCVAAIHTLAALVDHSADDTALNRGHRLIKATRGLCDAAQVALEHHETEHGCGA